MDDITNEIANQEIKKLPNLDRKYVKPIEKWPFLIGMASYHMFLGMINSYRGDYINNVLMVTESNQQLINIIGTLLCYISGLFLTFIIDNTRTDKGKFKPMAMMFTIPAALVGFFYYFTPMDPNSTLGVIYLIIIPFLFGIVNSFAGLANSVVYVMTPNEKERNDIMSLKSFFTAVAASAPLVVIAVLGIFVKKGYYNQTVMYIIGAALCAVLYATAMMLALMRVKERIPYTTKKINIFKGMGTVLKNKNFLCVQAHNILRNIRFFGTGLGIYIAGVLLGATSDFLFVGLPTGIGTFVGMTIVKFNLKKMDTIKVFVYHSFYSLIVNLLAFGAGYLYFTYPDNTFLMILFVFFLFAIGIQFGASNIIPDMINADVLNEIELISGKRLEQTMGFTSGLINMIPTLTMAYVGPYLLLNPNGVIKYQQGDAGNQTHETTLWLIFFYTAYVGIVYTISLLPFIGYKLTGERRRSIMEQLEKQREQIALEQGDDIDSIRA